MQLNVMCPINDRSLGILGLNYCLSLDKLGVDVALFPINTQNNLVFESEEDIKILQRQIANGSYFNANAT